MKYDTKVLEKRASLRELLWPIYGREHRIWLPMATMVGLILFNYTIARNMKDSLVVTATGSAVILPYLKSAIVLPASIIFFLCFAKLAQFVARRSLFYVVVSSFLLFYLLFGFVIYPAHEFLHPTTSADALEKMLPAGFSGLVDCYRVWTFSAFYAFSELWGVVVSGLMFWQFANDVIHVREAKRFYPHFYLLANVFVAFSGMIVSYISEYDLISSTHGDHWGSAIEKLCAVMFVAGILILVLYAYLDRVVFKEPDEQTRHVPKIKSKDSIWQSISHVFHSPYLGLIALLLIGYGITSNLIELTWKRQLSLLFTSGNQYASFMGYLSMATGIGTIIAIFLGSILLRLKGWLWAALATPLSISLTGSLFFSAVLFPTSLVPVQEAFNWTPVYVTVMIGFGLEVLVKSIKYALFDPTKEMTYIPLDVESRVQGKAAVDVVGNRLGKSGGGLIEIIAILIAGKLSDAISYFFLLFIIFCGLWTAGVVKLNTMFMKACKENLHENF